MPLVVSKVAVILPDKWSPTLNVCDGVLLYIQLLTALNPNSVPKYILTSMDKHEYSVENFKK